MSSRYYSEFPERKLPNPGKGPPTGQKGKKATVPKDATAAWPDLAGPGQPRDRSLGMRKAKVYADSKGL